MQFRISLIPATNVNRPGTGLDAAVGNYITVHETANTDPGADAAMHENFTHGGGGPETVSFHFVVDDHEAVQLLPLDEIGWHAGDGCDDYPDGVGADDIGCFASVAIETCVNSDGNWNQTLANLEELCAMIVKGDNRIDWGDGRIKNKMSQDRIAQHNAWSGKDCPHQIRAQGIWQAVLNGVARDVGATTTQYAKPIPIPAWDGTDKKQTNVTWNAIKRLVHISVATTPRAWASTKKESAAGPNMKAGTVIDILYLVQSGDKQWWYVTKEGYRILRGKCKEKFGLV